MEDKTLVVIGAILLGAVLFALLIIPAAKSDVLGSLGSGSLKFNFNATPSPGAIPTVTQLQAMEIRAGSGSAQVAQGDAITVNYIGAFMDGKKFDSSYDRNQPFTVVVGEHQVIPGFEQGVVGMKVGEVRRIIIPANLAYGAAGQGPIPPNTPIMFQIELLSINPAQQPSPSPEASTSPSTSPSPTESPTPTPEQ